LLEQFLSFLYFDFGSCFGGRLIRTLPFLGFFQFGFSESSEPVTTVGPFGVRGGGTLGCGFGSGFESFFIRFISRKNAQKTQKKKSFCAFCDYLATITKLFPFQFPCP
jgi:hypothetical protein